MVSDEILALSCPRWLQIKNLPPLLWKFIPQIVEPIGRVIRIDNSPNLIPHLDAKVLVSINPGHDVPRFIDIKIDEEPISCLIETLGGINSCFLC